MIIFYILWCIIFAILIFQFINRLVRFFIRRQILRKIPAPPGHWFWGNLSTDFRNDTDRLFYAIREYSEKYWPIYRFQTFKITVVNLLHPNDVEIVLSNMKHMEKDKVYNLLERWLGKGLLTSTGDRWHTRRKILTPAFHFTILKKYLMVFTEETDKLALRIEEKCHEPIDVVPLITQMTLQSIGETAMGFNELDPQTQEKYKNSLMSLLKVCANRLTKPWYVIPYLYQFSELYKEEVTATDYLHDFAYKIIKCRETELVKKYDTADEEGDTYSKRKAKRMVDLLLMAKMEGSDIDLEGIREEVDVFMFGGHDTTSVGIVFLLLVMANYQNVQETVLQEINDVLGSGAPTYANLQQLKYTEMVIKETLRLFPSIPFIARVAGEDFTTHTGYRIPKGTSLHIHIFDIHRNPRIYPDPLKFDPDRFLPGNTCQRHPFAYIPFSAGPRNCIGQRYAILELKAVLCGILRRFTLHQVDKIDDVTFHPDLVLRPKNGVRIKFVPK